MTQDLPLRLVPRAVPRAGVECSLLACRLLAELRRRRHAETLYVTVEAVQAAQQEVQSQVPRATTRQLTSALLSLVDRGYVTLPTREGR